jgi:FkbM family methyltransferase
MALSYAQNLEDYHLSLAFAGQKEGFYVDIGGGHPVADNVSFWFYERGWCGVVVEPQVELAALYPRLRPRDIVVQGLIGRENGEADFHIVDRLHGFSTAVETRARDAQAFGVGYRTVRVLIQTLAQLFERLAIESIDFLKIDVEGAEADVIAGNDWQRFRPKLVLAEAIALGSSGPGSEKKEQTWRNWEPLLLAQGYRLRLDDTLNRFYVAEEHPDIFARLPDERAPWDAVRHMYEIGRAPENQEHPDHALARDLARGFWASLPFLDHDFLASLIARGGGTIDTGKIDSDAFRAALGRIACGYDGGQIEPW